MIIIDLHCHLDGSIPKKAIRILAGEAGIPLCESEEELSELLQVRPDCRSLKEYLEKFTLPLSCLISEKAFETAAYEVMKEAADENVKYMELRFAPLLSETDVLTPSRIVESTIRGMKKAEEEFHMKGNLILCAMRHMPWEENLRVVRLVKEYLGNGVCGLDLAGDEAGYPVMLHREVFREAARMQIPFTIHAGECGSVQSIRDAVSLGAGRIGHGIAMAKDPDTRRLCREKKIGIEMCPVSNLQTKAVSSMEDYPFRRFFEEGLLVTVNTDNRTVSNTTIERELQVLEEQGLLEPEERLQLTKNSIEAAFAEDDVKEWLWKQL